ncbi:CCT domain - like 10 [Theobroma cacao]|nr:CCT domain - like 10 [Theobroma cacao]
MMLSFDLVSMKVDSDGDKGLRELNHQLCDGNKRSTNGVVTEEHVTLEGDELKVNEIAQNVNDGHVGAVQAPAVLQIPQQQPQNAMSSGSGSESGTQTEKSVKSKSAEKSDNNTGSNDEDDNGSIGLNFGDGSDDGSATQSSWTKQAVEVDSPRPVSPWDRVAECRDSTCAQVIHSNADLSGNKWVPVTAAKECKEQDEQLDNVAMGKDLDIGVPRNVDLQLEHPVEVPIKAIGTKQINLLEMGFSKFNEQIDNRKLDLNSETPSSKVKSEAPNQTGIISETTDLQKESADYEASNRLSKISDSNDKNINDSKELPSVDLGLKRLRGVKDAGTAFRDERNVLRRSDSSAFSRYNTASNANKVPTVNIGSSSALDNNIEETRKGSACDVRFHLLNEPPNQCSNVGSNNIDMGSTANNAFAKPAVLKNKSAASSIVRSSHPSSTFQPMKNDLSASQKVVLDKADDVNTTAGLAQPRGTHQELQMQHFPHHYDHHHHLARGIQQQQQPSEHNDLSLKKMAADAPHCGSSNVLGGPVEGNAGNYSVNGSASGSNHGSNGPNGSSTAVNTVWTNIESDNGIAGKSGSGNASGSGSGSGVDQSKSAHREAALTKFRQKRKERCFRKKVRYQSRKRLAEQRPRIRGQFVRQTANNNDPAPEGNS